VSDTVVKGKKAVADHFGVSPRQVLNWEKAGMPTMEGRRYDLVAIGVWRDQKKGVMPLGRPPGHPADPRQPTLPESSGKDFEDARMKRARADLLELDLKQRRGELVPRVEVQQMFVARIMAVKQGLLSLPRALPPQLMVCQNEREMEPVISKAVRDLLEAFARPLPESIGHSGQDLTQGGATVSTFGD
jgi:phage terminase Nu1 subunit (DNA packaging protein)